MAYKVTDACVNCGACESECPVTAISEKNDARWINPDTCIDCWNLRVGLPHGSYRRWLNFHAKRRRARSARLFNKSRLSEGGFFHFIDYAPRRICPLHRQGQASLSPGDRNRP